MDRWPWLILAILFMTFVFCIQGYLHCFVFQSFDFERAWWRWFQKRTVRTKLDIYVIIAWTSWSRSSYGDLLHKNTHRNINYIRYRHSLYKSVVCHKYLTLIPDRVMVMVFNATFNNISGISFRSFICD